MAGPIIYTGKGTGIDIDLSRHQQMAEQRRQTALQNQRMAYLDERAREDQLLKETHLDPIQSVSQDIMQAQAGKFSEYQDYYTDLLAERGGVRNLTMEDRMNIQNKRNELVQFQQGAGAIGAQLSAAQKEALQEGSPVEVNTEALQYFNEKGEIPMSGGVGGNAFLRYKRGDWDKYSTDFLKDKGVSKTRKVTKKDPDTGELVTGTEGYVAYDDRDLNNLVMGGLSNPGLNRAMMEDWSVLPQSEKDEYLVDVDADGTISDQEQITGISRWQIEKLGLDRDRLTEEGVEIKPGKEEKGYWKIGGEEDVDYNALIKEGNYNSIITREEDGDAKAEISVLFRQPLPVTGEFIPTSGRYFNIRSGRMKDAKSYRRSVRNPSLVTVPVDANGSPLPKGREKEAVSWNHFVLANEGTGGTKHMMLFEFDDDWAKDVINQQKRGSGITMQSFDNLRPIAIEKGQPVTGDASGAMTRTVTEATSGDLSDRGLVSGEFVLLGNIEGIDLYNPSEFRKSGMFEREDGRIMSGDEILQEEADGLQDSVWGKDALLNKSERALMMGVPEKYKYRKIDDAKWNKMSEAEQLRIILGDPETTERTTTKKKVIW